MTLHFPNSDSLHDLQKELLKAFHEVNAKVDVNYWSNLWLKWRCSIGAIFSALAVTYLCLKASRAIGHRLKHRRLRLRVEGKQRLRELNMSQLQRRLELSGSAEVLTKRREIILLGFDKLINRLQNSSLSASAVLEAYQWRALEAQAQTNCICEFLPDSKAWAAALDARYSSNASKSKPPLFGIPISLSESMEVSGHDSTLGLVSLIDHPSRDDSVLVKALKKLGAVPFVITNVPQSLLSLHCSNPVYGLTTNPHDPIRSAGGESSLVAMRGSPLGIGVDNPNGGVRVQAHWCGICALKPTSGRLSGLGVHNIAPDFSRHLLPPGLIAPSVDNIVSIMQILLDSAMFQLDPYTVPLPFNDRLYSDTRPLTIGYYHTDGLLTPLPACARAVDVARKILESNGHRLVQISLPFDFKELQDMLATYIALFVPHSGRRLVGLLQDDLLDDSVKSLYQFFAAPNKSSLIKRFGSNRFRNIYTAFSKSQSDQVDPWTKVKNWRLMFIKYVSERGLDCILTPASATTPLPIHSHEKIFCALSWYAALYNLLDCPAGVVRCGSVTSGDERAAMTEIDEIEEDCISKELRKAAEGSVGLPVGVQCVSLPYREEICLVVMKTIESGSR